MTKTQFLDSLTANLPELEEGVKLVRPCITDYQDLTTVDEEWSVDNQSVIKDLICLEQN